MSGISNSREVSRALLGARDGGRRGLPLAVAIPFVVGEKKQPVVLDRSASRAAELILLQRLYIGREEIARVHLIVAYELVERAMQVVRSGACNHRRGRRPRFRHIRGARSG